jgi:hypothetical protein
VNDSPIRIVECYKDYRPPFDVAKVVAMLLRTTPEKYLRGLDSVVLMDEASLPRKDRKGKTTSRKRKLDKRRILGRYHPQWHWSRPWIEIRVDKTLAGTPRLLLWLPPVRGLCLGDVLYHELGHHVHYFIRPEYREKEDVADDWGRKFMANFLRKRYWYAIWPLVLFSKLRKRISPRKEQLKADG